MPVPKNAAPYPPATYAGLACRLTGVLSKIPTGRIAAVLFLWLKALHIVFVVTWFAGLFYLPRLFMYHATATDSVSLERFIVMERRLFVIMTIGATLAALFGLSMIATVPGYLDLAWMHAKLTFVALLIGYHLWCWKLMRDLRTRMNVRSQKWYRLFNEAPSLLLIVIVVLVVVKPF
jgi:protoporphyrinogen IX oxidase